MTLREKKLMLIVGGAVGLFGAYRAVMSSVVEPRKQLVAEIQTLSDRKTQLETRVMGEIGAERLWEAQTARTLGPSARRDKAHDTFRSDITSLLKQHRLPEKGVQNRQPTATGGSKTHRKDFWELPLVVDTEGTLEQLTEFLHDVYQLGYHVTVDKLTINPKDGEAAILSATNNTPDADKKKRGGRAGKNDGESPLLKLHIELATLVLPQMPGRRHIVFNPESPGKPLARLRFPDEAEYTAIAQRNPFAVWQPKHVEVVKSDPVPTTQVVKDDKPPPPPPENPRKDADKLVLIATLAFDNEPVVFVKNNGKLTDPPAQYRLNEALDGGKLILILGNGMVVRMASGGDAGKLYFYELGEKFSERTELSADKYPEIYQTAQVVLQQ